MRVAAIVGALAVLVTVGLFVIPWLVQRRWKK